MDQWSHAQAPTHATPRTDRGKVSATATSCRKVEWKKRRAAARLDMRESLRLLLLPDNSLTLKRTTRPCCSFQPFFALLHTLTILASSHPQEHAFLSIEFETGNEARPAPARRAGGAGRPPG
eukprot:scaffold71846_cov66-Phaeocystis_antarctica.AAC.2